jgi:cobalt/nickel transport system permease protein
MHIPDGFLSVPVSLLLWAISIVIIAIALRRVNQTLGERQVPLMGVLAACIFAGQMLNFAVAGGTSGHLLGAALAVILLGPWASILVMTCVVGVQALLFQDGGLLALGGNIFNMAIIGTAVSYAAYSLVSKIAGGKKWGVFAGGAVAAWLSILLAALAAAIELAASGTSPANVGIPAMGAVHALIGIGEALITVGALSVIYAARRDLLMPGEGAPASSRAVLAGGLLVALVLAVASPLASANPDGLEWVAEQQGFLSKAQESPFQVIPDYAIPGVGSPELGTILAGVVGALAALMLALAVAYSRRGKTTSWKIKN